ncbi:MAG: hypothetical protein IKW39_01980 [Alphaproteobacteria bacterium]|nr:hypothetical protein [Alphaproteobacteria bacterium]
MKKIFVVLGILGLSSCGYFQGDYTLGKRNTLTDFFYTYNINYYMEGAFEETETETIAITDYKAGSARHAVPGGIVVSSKIYQKLTHSDEFVRPTSKGAMVSATVPVEFSDEKVYKAIGEVEINGKVLRLLEPNRIGDILLIDERGNVYPRVGRIYNDRLALLDSSFILEPTGTKFLNETMSTSSKEEVVSGFEIRYMGMKDYQMEFEYSAVSPNNGMPIEASKTFMFPMYDKEVEIEGVKLEILNIDESGIEYKILDI